MKKPPKAETPKEEFIRRKREAKKEMNLSDRSIEGWSDIILGKRKKKGGDENA